MAFKISELKFPQWAVNRNFLFDMTANWIDKTFFGSKYSPTPEKTMIIALCTNIFGLHRVYAGRKISAVVGWFFLFLSLIAREYVFMLLFWLAVDMVRICLCNYGRVKSKQGFNLHELKKLLFRKAGRGGMAISGSVSVLALALLLAFAPKAESKPRDLTVSRSDLYVSQTDAAYSDLQELEAQIESKSSLMEEMNLYDQNREKNQAQIESLKKEIADLMADKQSLQSELQELKSEIESQKKLLEKMQKQTDELIKAQQSTTTKATTTQKSTTTTAKKAITTTKKPTTKKSTTTTKKTTTTTKKTTTTTTVKNHTNILMNLPIREGPVMNGFKTKRIGTYGYIKITKELMKGCSEQDYIEFITKRVENSGYNWFSIEFEDGTGILFPGCLIYQGEYGKLDEELGIQDIEGYVCYWEGKVTYENY